MVKVKLLALTKGGVLLWKKSFLMLKGKALLSLEAYMKNPRLLFKRAPLKLGAEARLGRRPLFI